MEDFLGIVVFIAFWSAVIAIIVNKKKKKEQTRKTKRQQNDMVNIFMRKIRDFDQIKFPEYYFEELYFSFDKSDTPIKEKVEVYSDYFDTMADEELYDGYISLLKTIEEYEEKNSSLSLFLRNKEDLERYTGRNKEVPNLNEKISNEIVTFLNIYRNLKTTWVYFLEAINQHSAFHDHFSKTFFGITYMYEDNRSEKEELEYQSALKTFNITYKFALNQQWNSIISEYPNWNTPELKNLYFHLAEDDDIARQNWLSIFQKKFIDVNSNTGFEKFQELLLNFMKNMAQFSDKSFFLCVRDGLNEYSSIYEIEDFSVEEVNRIIDLYEQKVIVGAYSKEKDPKYQ